MSGVSGSRRFRMSIRSLMVAIALCAVLLYPVVLLVRRTAALMRAERRAAELASMQAVTARNLLQVQSAQVLFNGTKAVTPGQPKMGVPREDRQGNLWAALGVNRPFVTQGQTKDLRIDFTLVNDADTVIDPRIAESHIVINGKELADSDVILGNAPKDSRLSALPPGDHLQFGFALGEFFNEPGIYRVSWKGTGFQSPEIVIRIMPEKDE